MYSLLGAGLHGINGINPLLSYKLWRTYVIPRMLYGIEILNITKTDIQKLEAFSEKTFKQILSLPQRTADAAIYILLGAESIEQLNFRNSRENTKENRKFPYLFDGELKKSLLVMGALHGTTGFYKSPSSKGLLTATLLSSFALNFPFQQYRHYFWYNPHLIVEKQQLWRIFSSKVAYLDLKDMCCCSILMYYFRIFERRYGSRKFLSYMLSTAIISTALELSVIYLFQHLQIKLQPLPSGPLCMLYPLFIPYYCEVPRVVFGHIFGIPMTGKSFHYILGLQIASQRIIKLPFVGCFQGYCGKLIS
ncbi:Ubiquitin-associated domain-containing protein 2 [Mytilus edulis]|uniref:Ubiquitin-associated domain-containing protein 2 n=1 Tax=Mytilus edulis TaxID=6550 RepID=A0A8S3SCC8_MYTED|nr:Ubiquitin-associated domain-containing protein 2 [Mytilus edulis]